MRARYHSLAPLIDWREPPWPRPWAQDFGRAGRLVLELGCGNGEAIVRRAAAEPEANFVGLDLAWLSVRNSLRRVAQAGLSNVRLLHASAQNVVERLVAPAQLSEAYCLYPCPWPKDKHEAKRLFGAPFLRLLNTRLAPGGRATVVTDDQAYLSWIVAQADESTGFAPRWRAIGPGHDTKYERKWAAGGQREFYELTLTKARHLRAAPPEEPQLQTPWLDSFDPARLAPFEHKGRAVVRCRDVLYDAERRRAMLQMTVVEDGFRQVFYVEVAEADGRWRVGLAKGSPVAPTAGVQEALDTVATALGGAPAIPAGQPRPS